MKVIAGKYKNRNLNFVSDEKTRPTASMVREALFSKIQFGLEGATFLDLFAGSGSVGIEALSRGAKKVVFVEKDRKNFEIIKSNLENCKIPKEDYELIFSDYVSALGRIADKFDFVYIDPPYKSEYYETSLKLLLQNDLLNVDAIIICEHEYKNQIDFHGFEILVQKKYGIKMLTYLTVDKEGQHLQDCD